MAMSLQPAASVVDGVAAMAIKTLTKSARAQEQTPFAAKRIVGRRLWACMCYRVYV